MFVVAGFIAARITGSLFIIVVAANFLGLMLNICVWRTFSFTSSHCWQTEKRFSFKMQNLFFKDFFTAVNEGSSRTFTFSDFFVWYMILKQKIRGDNLDDSNWKRNFGRCQFFWKYDIVLICTSISPPASRTLLVFLIFQTLSIIVDYKPSRTIWVIFWRKALNWKTVIFSKKMFTCL